MVRAIPRIDIKRHAKCAKHHKRLIQWEVRQFVYDGYVIQPQECQDSRVPKGWPIYSSDCINSYNHQDAFDGSGEHAQKELAWSRKEHSVKYSAQKKIYEMDLYDTLPMWSGRNSPASQFEMPQSTTIGRGSALARL